MIRRVLIANRGEIARRVIRTCHAMRIETVAVYSEVDHDAPHVREATSAVAIGPAAASESYLKIPALIDAVRKSGADAVHPGYGFLSENAAFAEACEAAGVIFIGPPAAVIRRMGSKTGTRALMAAAGVPIVPGVTPAAQDDESIAAAVREVGFPALLKAAGGGGGKGMRVVRAESEIADAIGAARRESERAFGNPTLYVERLVERPRHIEIQIFADTYGNTVHVLERECSLQRRHQKVIEEAPAPRLAPRVRAQIRTAAIAAARAVEYVNAGTCEFLLEGEGDQARFYFLEMNTRLQVEHPVTEAVTGLDLVRAQIVVANDQPLPFTQQDVVARGHAIECRIYAEDPRTLLPQSGRLLRYVEPEGAGIRIDGGVREGQTITVHYDPLIAKAIAHGDTREIARERLIGALQGFLILGLHHNVALLATLLALPEFVASTAYTTLMEERGAALLPPASSETLDAAAALAAFVSPPPPAAAPPPAEAGGEAAPVGVDPWDALGPVVW